LTEAEKKQKDRPSVPDIICANCPYYMPVSNSPHEGLCYRYPPQVFDNNTQSRPRVSNLSFCGEHPAFKNLIKEL
jgi:hypothetical protein